MYESNSKQMRGEDEDMTNLRMQTKYAALLLACSLYKVSSLFFYPSLCLFVTLFLTKDKSKGDILILEE